MILGIREHFVTIRRHWAAVLTVLLAALALSGAMALLISPSYKASAQMLVLGSSQAQRATQMEFADESRSSPHEQVETQVQIARSRHLAEALARRLGPETVLSEMRWRWDWLRAVPGQLRDQLVFGVSRVGPIAALLDATGLRPAPRDAADGPLAEAREKLRDALEIHALPKSDIFVINATAPSPEFAARIVNTMAEVYIAHVVELRSNPEGTALIARGAADRLATELRAAEIALNTFTAEHDIFAIDQQKTLLLDRLARLQDEAQEAARGLIEAERKQASIEDRIAGLSVQGRVSLVSRPNPVVDQLRQRLATLEGEAGRFTPGSPAEARVRADIAGIRAQLRSLSAEVEGFAVTGRSNLHDRLQTTLALQQAELQALGVRRQFVERQLEAAEARLRALDAQEMTYRGLRRAVQSKETAYLAAAQQREETVLADELSEASLASVTQVEAATPPERPAAPNRGAMLALGLVLGGLGGIALAYLLEFGRRTMATPDEAEFALGLRVVAAIDRLGLLVRNSARNEVEYRRFASWLSQRAAAGDPATLAFASAHRNPAQADVVDQTAAALRRAGRRTLIVRLSPVADAEEVTRTLPEPDAAQPVARLSGPPWALADALQALLAEPGGDFAHILLDSPGPGNFPEHLTLVPVVPHVLMLIEADRTRVDDAEAALRDLSEAGATLTGLVLNNRRARSASWAFCWMSLRRRRTLARQVADA